MSKHKRKRTYWVDLAGNEWAVSTSSQRLTFKSPGQRALRVFVFKRDRYTCRHCEARPTFMEPDYDGGETICLDDERKCCLVTDHIIARHNGGSHHPDNLQTLCWECNSRKGAYEGRIQCPTA